MTRQVVILGTHGIPARHGGFETFAEKLALHLAQQQWEVTVFGQADGAKHLKWHDIDCIYISKNKNSLLKYIDPILYDLKAVWQSRKIKGTILTLGYNTAIFNIFLFLLRRKQIINMDGIEWQRSKYKYWHEKAWLRLNEWTALKIADVCIADHDEIAKYLVRQSPETPVITIAYGADNISQTDTDATQLEQFDLKPYQYGLIIARAEPENQIAEIIQAWKNSETSLPLVILGHYNARNPYQNYVLSLADQHIKFVGAIYDTRIVNTLRSYTALYLHGHKVGGTNPSLIEAMATACPIIAHDNPFNRGTADDGALYFTTVSDLAEKIDNLLQNNDQARKLGNQAKARQSHYYQWDTILNAYQQLLEKFH